MSGYFSVIAFDGCLMSSIEFSAGKQKTIEVRVTFQNESQIMPILHTKEIPDNYNKKQRIRHSVQR